ncbi:hypothetical protein OIU34_18845 [Pararhizobium sp. BT-229]|uniref:hypothetical protein n=1 Tax=Pararhizobium sp. BT-229 TaxID=2986923 RepID=UPI0021F7736D|nr:hypothetical protein [Pararhizobium sp. BT-229]MCV9963939.1 hypothetical protein [Pararhizobium sp. BT-229]
MEQAVRGGRSDGARAERRSRRPAANPHTTPDYSRLKPCEATADELAVLGASSVRDLVAKMNKALIAKGLLPISQGDYPNTRKRLLKLLERWKRSGR